MDVWIAEDDVQETMRELISQYHPDLVAVEKQTTLVFREKATKAGDGVFLGKSKKAPPLLGVLTDTDWKFVIELAWDEWQSLNSKQRVALIDHHLCACRVELDQKTQDVKRCYIQPPDVAFYKDEVERHGFWRTGHHKPPEDDLIMELFGDDQA